MCMQCAVIAVAAIGAAGVMRDQVVSRLDLVSSDDTKDRPPTMLFLLVLAALVNQDHSQPPAERQPFD